MIGLIGDVGGTNTRVRLVQIDKNKSYFEQNVIKS